MYIRIHIYIYVYINTYIYTHICLPACRKSQRVHDHHVPSPENSRNFPKYQRCFLYTCMYMYYMYIHIHVHERMIIALRQIFGVILRNVRIVFCKDIWILHICIYIYIYVHLCALVHDHRRSWHNFLIHVHTCILNTCMLNTFV